MATRILTFGPHLETVDGVTTLGSAFYIGVDSRAILASLYALRTPTNDALIDVLDDGASIFNNRTLFRIDGTTGVDLTGDVVTGAVLPAGTNSEPNAEDFPDEEIAAGSWLTCRLLESGAGSGFTLQVTLSSID